MLGAGMTVLRPVMRRMARVSDVAMSVARGASAAEVRGIAHVSAVATMPTMTTEPGVAKVSQPADRHRRQPGTTEGEAETIEVHTEYYVSNPSR